MLLVTIPGPRPTAGMPHSALSDPPLPAHLPDPPGPKQTPLWVHRWSIWQPICGCAGEYWEDIPRLLVLDTSGRDRRSESSPSCPHWTLEEHGLVGKQGRPRSPWPARQFPSGGCDHIGSPRLCLSLGWPLSAESSKSSEKAEASSHGPLPELGWESLPCLTPSSIAGKRHHPSLLSPSILKHLPHTPLQSLNPSPINIYCCS